MLRGNFLLVFLLLTINGLAQQLTDTVAIDYTQYKGKLLVLNECHGVASNDKVYEHIIRQIAANSRAGDTLNLILEGPYSSAYIFNKYLHGDGPGVFHSNAYIRDLKGVPLYIRVIAGDFEYCSSKRVLYYIAFLNDKVKELSECNVSVALLKTYMTGIKSDSFKLELKGRKTLMAFYADEQNKQTAGGKAYKAIEELLFVLEAEHTFSSHVHRDKNTYSRLMKAQDMGRVKFSYNYNLLIHGAIHTDPSKRRDIYNYFQKRHTSPFRDNVYSIAQIHIDCMSAGDYFSQTRSKVKGSLLAGNTKHDDMLIDYIKTKYNSLPHNSVINIRDIGDAPNIGPYKQRIVSWYIHWLVE